jgi:hypothetical protein
LIAPRFLPAVLDSDILALDVSQLARALPKRRTVRLGGRGIGEQQADTRDSGRRCN